MSSGIIIAIIVVVVLIVLAVGVWMAVRRRHLRERFGPEYERAVEAGDSRTAAERDLRDREQRHDDLDLKPLPSTARQQYAQEWNGLQEHFVDRPREAVGEADQLVTRLMKERGYPTEGYEQQVKDLSVEHGRTLEHYRAAHEVNARAGGQQTTTEELRGAMVHYRALFDDLLTNGDRPGQQHA
ncbi:hypothetical protein [Streptomyces sp. NBC_01800]|uniref:hypothetical protein n=1 Tax=Streptomyces sp. NBC_01800 TaxID=2975945 RepID=UPI002DD8D650|nr:hypothetical protein [Streptomyces sp. NBC_01800]WSA73267.1 hypothetical protein OIE65_44260 [Streptomyces sp. NBC_01800]